MNRISYEMACELQRSLWSPERLREKRLGLLREENRRRLFEVGWTSEELGEEAGRRMRARIAELKKAEGT